MKKIIKRLLYSVFMLILFIYILLYLIIFFWGGELDWFYHEYDINNQSTNDMTLSYFKNNINNQSIISSNNIYILKDWYIVWDWQFEISRFYLVIKNKTIYVHKTFNSKMPQNCPVWKKDKTKITEEKWKYIKYFPFYSQWNYTKCIFKIIIN